MGHESRSVELATITTFSESDSQALLKHKSFQSENESENQNGNGNVNGNPGKAPEDKKRVCVRTLILASVVAVGLQFGWAVQLSLLTPYVQTLGVEHAFSSFIWLCGPITGLVVQPCMGVWSDRCKLRFGRRRPFILAGALVACVAVTVIGFSADVGYILGDTRIDCRTYKGSRPRAAAIFIIGFWLLDLANNTIQGPARALLADLSGSEKRDFANATFCLWMALGNILGFATGASGELYKFFPFLATRACCEDCVKLKSAFLIHVILMAFCTAITLWFVREEPLEGGITSKPLGDTLPLLRLPETNGHMAEVDLTNGEAAHQNANVDADADAEGNKLGSVMVNLLTSVRHLPPQMKNILIVMALCWLAWFPFFLFDTDWMGREVYHGSPSGNDREMSAYRTGVKQGAFGLLLNSVVLAFGSFMIDPLCRWMGSKNVWALSNFSIFLCMLSTTIVTAFSLRDGPNGGPDLNTWVKPAAITIFAFLGAPLAVTYSVPYSITAELTADSGGGQGVAMGILNLSIVVPQMVVALGIGPWDALFGGGNVPAFALSAVFALAAGFVAIFRLPQLSATGYVSATGHGFG